MSIDSISLHSIRYARAFGESGIKRIEQPYPELQPFTLFPSFDYVSEPYADILDPIAIILALWLAIAAATKLSHVLYGKSTQTIAIRDMIDRMISVDLSSYFSLRTRTYIRPKVRCLSNIPLRLIAIVFFVLLFSIEAAAVFSQSSRRHWRGLQELNLKRLTFQTTEDPTKQLLSPRIGCTPLIRMMSRNNKIPLYLCSNVGFFRSSRPFSINKFDLYFDSTDDRYFKMWFQDDSEYSIVLSYSIQIRDEAAFNFLFGNLTAWDFKMTESRLSWLTASTNKIINDTNARSEFLNATTSRIYGDDIIGDYVSTAVMAFARAMFNLSSETLKTDDFITAEAEKISGSDSSLLTRLTSGKIKRLSGFILWVIAAVLAFIKVLVEYITWDMDEDINIMVAEALEIPRAESLRFGSNRTFRIVNSESCDGKKPEGTDEDAPEVNGNENSVHLKLQAVQ